MLARNERFVVGDVIAFGDDFRNPYGRVIGTGVTKKGQREWQIETVTQAPNQLHAWVWRDDASLMDFSPIVSAVRGVCGNILINEIAAVYNEEIAAELAQNLFDNAENELWADFG